MSTVTPLFPDVMWAHCANRHGMSGGIVVSGAVSGTLGVACSGPWNRHVIWMRSLQCYYNVLLLACVY